MTRLRVAMTWTSHHHQRHALTAAAAAVLLLLSLLGGAVAAAEGDAAAAQGSSSGRPSFFSQFRLAEQEDYRTEVAFALFVLLSVFFLIVGGRDNEALATHWVTEMVRPGGVLDRNFALVGPHAAAAAKGEVLMKETPDTFRLYASGRRSCQVGGGGGGGGRGAGAGAWAGGQQAAPANSG